MVTSPFNGVRMPSPASLQSGMPSGNGSRKLAKKARNGQLPGALGEYPDDLYHRVLQTKGGAGQMGGRGPVNAPVIQGPQEDDLYAYLRRIIALLERLPEAMSLEWRKKFIMPPRESVSFIAPGGPTTISAGTAVAVVSQTVVERFTGFLEGISMNVTPTGAYSDITWQVRVDGAIHPEFANRIFSMPNMATPFKFRLELVQARTVELVAINGGAVDLEVSGILQGWTEYMADYKPYGASSAAGFA